MDSPKKVALVTGAARGIGLPRRSGFSTRVDNAGRAVFKPVPDTTLAEWNDVLAIKLSGPFLCTQAATPLMRKQGGGIVNTRRSRVCAPARCVWPTAPARRH